MLCQQLAAQPGARLLLSGRDDAKLIATAQHAAAGPGVEVGTVAADPLDPSAVEGVLAEAVARYGRVDGVANCVGSVLLKSGDARPLLDFQLRLKDGRPSLLGSFHAIARVGIICTWPVRLGATHGTGSGPSR